MRALVMEGYGSVEMTRLAEVPKPDYGPTDLLVRNAAAAINPVEYKEIAGHLKQFYPQTGPYWIVGGDGAGIVDAVGAQVRQFVPADAVLFITDRGPGGGSLAEYTRVPAILAGRAPRTINLTAAASIPTAGLTAYQALFRPDQGDLKRGQSVLIHGASGGVGSFAIGFAHAQGLDVVATCRPDCMRYVQTLGANHAVDYAGDVGGGSRAFKSDGMDVVLDCYSGGRRKDFLDAIRPGGRLVVVLTGTQDADMATLAAEGKARNISVHFMIIDMNRGPADFARIAELIDSGTMRMPDLSVYLLEQATEALIAMTKGRVRGKIVVRIADPEK
jgi:NADPH:quinone reductase